MEESFKIIDNCLCIRMPEEVDHHSSEYISHSADRYILDDQIESIVFDFEDTRFMDSSGIGILIGRYKKIACFGGKVYVVHPDRQIKRLLTLSGVQQLVEIMD